MQNAIICDLDGTLAEIHSGRNPYDASTCDLDTLIEPVALVLRMIADQNPTIKILLCSGRMEKDRAPTLAFLSKNNVPFDHLFMRPNRDMRKDSIIKQEIYTNNIEPFYKILFVIDDRPQVVAAWRSLGLFVFDVNQTGRDF